MLVQVINRTFLMKMVRESIIILLQFHKTVIGNLSRKKGASDVYWHISCILEIAEITGMKQDKNHHNLCVIHTAGFVMMFGLFILNHIFFLLQCKFLLEIIGHIINLWSFRLWKHSDNRLNVITGRYNFNTFIAMLLYPNRLYLVIYRTHVNKIKGDIRLSSQWVSMSSCK